MSENPAFYATPKKKAVYNEVMSMVFIHLDSRQRWLCKANRATNEIHCMRGDISMYLKKDDFKRGIKMQPPCIECGRPRCAEKCPMFRGWFYREWDEVRQPFLRHLERKQTEIQEVQVK